MDNEDKLPKSRSIVARAILTGVAYIGFLLAVGSALGSCAAFNTMEYHGVVTVSGPTRIVTGPTVGHWMMDDGSTAVIVYTVLGDDCELANRQSEAPSFQSQGRFVLAPGVSLCMEPLVQGRDQFIELHAKR